jgi:transcriptional regulator with XRE-family HTH domain
MTARKKTKDMLVGLKIKKARTEKNLTFEYLANETGLSIAYLKKIEGGKEIPSVGTLLQIAKALQIDSGFLFKEQEEILEKRIDAYSKRTDNYAYASLSPGAESKHLKAFKVSIEPMKQHEGVGYCHEGEEFVFILKGKVSITVGDHKNVLHPNDSLQFNSGIKHQMTNISNEVAEMLVVIYSP